MKKNNIVLLVGKVLISVVLLFVILVAGNIIWNKMAEKNFDKLGLTEQRILSELDSLYRYDRETKIWPGFDFSKKAILIIPDGNVMEKFFGCTYIANCEGLENSLFAQKINVPENSGFRSLYRLSAATPETIGLKFSVGNFPGIGEELKLGESELYYIKYNKEDSLDRKNSSLHFVPFLTHESFHYYMQGNWKIEIPFIEDTDEQQIALIKEEYDVLDKMQQELAKGQPDKALLERYAAEYVSVMDRRVENDANYVQAETLKETAEGTATYISIKAAQIVGYDYGVMYFDNRERVPFSEVFPAIEAGALPTSEIAGRMPYETGALLCFVLDALQVEDWQLKLNAQTPDAPITLYSLLKNRTA